jgi:hypothetical protein
MIEQKMSGARVWDASPFARERVRVCAKISGADLEPLTFILSL